MISSTSWKHTNNDHYIDTHIRVSLTESDIHRHTHLGFTYRIRHYVVSSTVGHYVVNSLPFALLSPSSEHCLSKTLFIKTLFIKKTVYRKHCLFDSKISNFISKQNPKCMTVVMIPIFMRFVMNGISRPKYVNKTQNV